MKTKNAAVVSMESCPLIDGGIPIIGPTKCPSLGMVTSYANCISGCFQPPFNYLHLQPRLSLRESVIESRYGGSQTNDQSSRLMSLVDEDIASVLQMCVLLSQRRENTRCVFWIWRVQFQIIPKIRTIDLRQFLRLNQYPTHHHWAEIKTNGTGSIFRFLQLFLMLKFAGRATYYDQCFL